MTRTKRTIYFNDARHYYLFVHEPPMRLEDAWSPIDEVAGTGVDTFVYGVERTDGLFYPSKRGLMFGEGKHPMTSVAEWRTWKNMRTLIDRGYDPLRVLIDRSHEKGLDFVASLRFSGYGGLEDRHRIPVPEQFANDPLFGETSLVFTGADHSHQEVRDHQFGVLEELATDYATDGIELDFIFSTFYFKYGEGRHSLSTMTELVGRISEMAKARNGTPAVVGARVLPTEEMCLDAGLDIRRWLSDGLIDYVVPLIYDPFLLDGDMPIEWLVEAAHEADASVYGFLHPYRHAEHDRRFHTVAHANPEMFRAAASNHLRKGVDGLYTWFLKWPHGSAERALLAEIGDPDLMGEKTKHYFIPWRSPRMAKLGYDWPVPAAVGVGGSGTIPFFVSDDLDATRDRVARVLLRLNIGNAVSDDAIAASLNGDSLAAERTVRQHGGVVAPYESQWLEIELEKVRPRLGRNELTLSLNSRPEDLHGEITVLDLEVVIEYAPYPSRPSMREEQH